MIHGKENRQKIPQKLCLPFLMNLVDDLEQGKRSNAIFPLKSEEKGTNEVDVDPSFIRQKPRVQLKASSPGQKLTKFQWKPKKTMSATLRFRNSLLLHVFIVKFE